MRYTQANDVPSNSAANSLPTAFFGLEFRCRITPQPTSKLLKQIIFSPYGGVLPRLICVFSLLAGKCRSIAARRIDPVEKRPARFAPADIVEDDRGRGRGVGEGGDARVTPERVIGGQRLVAENVEHRRRDLPGGEGRD